MAIDIIRKKVENRVSFILISFIASVNIAFSQTEECQVHAVGFDVLSKDYSQFSSTIDSYYASEYIHDFLILKIKGGNPIKSFVLRYYLDNSWHSCSMVGDGSGESSKILPDSVLINQISSIKNVGDYMEICPFSSSNDTYIYMIKRDGEVHVKYQSSYPIFPERKGMDGLKNFIERLAEL